jgi:hemoglobin
MINVFLNSPPGTILRPRWKVQRWIAAVAFAFLLSGSAGIQAADVQKSLYDRLGGQPAIEAVANGLVDRILADNRVNQWFSHAAASAENANA